MNITTVGYLHFETGIVYKTRSEWVKAKHKHSEKQFKNTFAKLLQYEAIKERIRKAIQSLKFWAYSFQRYSNLLTNLRALNSFKMNLTHTERKLIL